MGEQTTDIVKKASDVKSVARLAKGLKKAALCCVFLAKLYVPAERASLVLNTVR